jgi:transposase
MGGAEEEKQRIADLEKEIAKRNRWIDQRNRRIDKLEEENERLRREIEKLQQAAKRQAAPFSRGEPKRHPKRRGRKPGKRYGRRAFRPVPRRIDRIVEVPAPLYCPDCQKQTKLDHRETQWQTDIPPVEPVTTEFRIDVARCVECGRTIRNQHPEQISSATGAAGVQLGPRLIALAATLNKECGVSYERIGRLLRTMFGLYVNRSSLNRAVLRLAGIVRPLSEKIGRRVRDAPMLSPDETGWKVGGERAWLHVAATREDSYYMITRGRGTREATSLIGINYSGRIVRDGHPSYRVFTKAKSQTCLAHLLRRIDGLLEINKTARVESWLRGMKQVLKRSISISQRRDAAKLGPHGLMVAIGKVETDVDHLLGEVPRCDEVQRFARHLRRERSALFTFLYYDATPATNFLAEQALRPAVVNRKMSAGNNSPRGATAQATLMTVLHTARKRSADTLALVVDALRNPAAVQQLL